MSGPHCLSRSVILVPDLFWPEPEESHVSSGLICPGLEAFLSRCASTVASKERLGFEEIQVQLLIGADTGFPIAALRALGETSFDGFSPEALWCADPVHLRLFNERIFLADSATFPLSQEEASELVSDLNKEFADLGMFFAPHPQRWYLQPNPAVLVSSLRTLPLSQVAGKHLEELHQGGGGREAAYRILIRWQNEIQMYLHGHPVNTRREAAGLDMVNGIWLWGSRAIAQSGEVSVTKPSFSRICGSSENALLKGLCRVWGLAWEPVTSLHADEPVRVPPGSLLVWEELLRAARYGDGEAWRIGLERFERRVMQPLLAERQDFQLIISGASGHFVFDSSNFQRWAFWRKSKPLGQIMGKLSTWDGA